MSKEFDSLYGYFDITMKLNKISIVKGNVQSELMTCCLGFQSQNWVLFSKMINVYIRDECML